MRLRPDELAEWRERAAQTVRPDDHPMPYQLFVADDDEARYELALRRYAWGTLAALALHGAPRPDDAERKVANARSHTQPALTDSCRASVGPGCSPACDRSCKQER